MICRALWRSFYCYNCGRETTSKPVYKPTRKYFSFLFGYMQNCSSFSCECIAISPVETASDNFLWLLKCQIVSHPRKTRPKFSRITLELPPDAIRNLKFREKSTSGVSELCYGNFLPMRRFPSVASIFETTKIFGLFLGEGQPTTAPKFFSTKHIFRRQKFSTQNILAY